jgi:acyl-coenzyme A thioesterase PaaI-like protein
MSDDARSWIERSPYSRFLGVELTSLDPETIRLSLPYRDENSNPSKALHGGVAASLGAIAAHGLARPALGPEAGPLPRLRAAAALSGRRDRRRGWWPWSRMLRQGKEICFAEVDVATAAGKPIAQVTAAVRGRFGAEPDSPERNGDASGGVHEGAVLALLDTAGAMAAWAETGATASSFSARSTSPAPTTWAWSPAVRSSIAS